MTATGGGARGRAAAALPLAWCLLACAAGLAAGGERGAGAGTGTMQAAAGPRVAVGAAAPEITLGSSDGRAYSLAERRGRNPVVIVFFRGTW